MNDREKVIKGLEEAIQHYSRYSGDEYGREFDYARVEVDVLEDALALLKAQEPLEPFMQYSEHTGTKWICCGACEQPIAMAKDSYKPKYCPDCGQAVKWE